jgi:hypothetical protein
MQFAEAEANETMFHHGQDGDLFYLILDGTVEIRVPDFKNMQDFNAVQLQIDHLREQLRNLQNASEKLEKESNKLKLKEAI